MNYRVIFIFCLCACLLTACSSEPVCEPGTIQYYDSVEEVINAGQSLPAAPTESGEVMIKGKMVKFDQVIHGPLCNNVLRGKVYIACDVAIVKWDEAPNFFDGCSFEVEPGAEITVASHNNTVYYNGCDSCHVGGEK